MNLALLRPTGAPLMRVGHRGAKGHAPENTLASFELAVKMGVQAVETDVHLSRDGELVCIHDHTVDRTTDGRGFVKDLTLAELKQLDAGGWYGPEFAGQRILTLAELLAWAKPRVGVAIEIKNGPIYYPGIAAKTLTLLRDYEMLQQAILLSFDHFVLREAGVIEPAVATGLLYVGRLVDPVGAARAAGASSLNPNWAFVTPDLVALAHEARLAVSPWCPNDLSTLRMLDRMGVDSVGTDYPDLLAEL
jgi:glycerophosphoryl diester phosphodiesterase